LMTSTSKCKVMLNEVKHLTVTHDDSLWDVSLRST
jgi:hypothetical protein